MKKALRIVSVLLLIVMLGSTLVACNTDTPKTTGAKPTAAQTDDSSSTLPAKLKEVIDKGGFDGQEIGIVVSGGSVSTRSIYVDTESEDFDETDPINIAVDRRNKKVEEELKVKLRTFKTLSGGELVNHIREYLNSPDSYYDIIGGYQYYDLGLGFGDNSGTLVNYSNIDDEDMIIDLNADYWDKDTFETLGYDGANFWITGDLSQTWISTMFVSYVNSRLWKENISEIKKYTDGEEDIYKVVKSGKWSIDLWLELNEILYRDLNHNEIVDDGDQVGFVGFAATCGINDVVVDGMLAGSHVTLSKISNGTPVISYPNNEFKNYATAMKNLYNGSKSLLLPSYDSDRMTMHIFAEGNALMTVHTLEQAETYLGDMEDDYYILPPPKSNVNQDNYYTSCGDTVNQFGILARTENLQATTATLEALGYYSKEYVTPKYFDEALKGKYTRGDAKEAAEMIDFIRSRIYSDFVIAWGREIGGGESPSWYFRNNIGKSIDGNLVTKSKAAAWSKQLDNLLDSLSLSGGVEL